MISFVLWELTLQEVISDIPHDAGALVAYALLGLFVGFVWMGNRNRGGASYKRGRDAR